MSWYVWMFGRYAWSRYRTTHRNIYQGVDGLDGPPDEVWVRVISGLYRREIQRTLETDTFDSYMARPFKTFWYPFSGGFCFAGTAYAFDHGQAWPSVLLPALGCVGYVYLSYPRIKH